MTNYCVFLKYLSGFSLFGSFSLLLIEKRSSLSVPLTGPQGQSQTKVLLSAECPLLGLLLPLKNYNGIECGGRRQRSDSSDGCTPSREEVLAS